MPPMTFVRVERHDLLRVPANAPASPIRSFDGSDERHDDAFTVESIQVECGHVEHPAELVRLWVHEEAVFCWPLADLAHRRNAYTYRQLHIERHLDAILTQLSTWWENMTPSDPSLLGLTGAAADLVNAVSQARKSRCAANGITLTEHRILVPPRGNVRVDTTHGTPAVLVLAGVRSMTVR